MGHKIVTAKETTYMFEADNRFVMTVKRAGDSIIYERGVSGSGLKFKAVDLGMLADLFEQAAKTLRGDS